MQKIYDFKLLHEEVAEDDLFEDKTHNNIADSIVDLIKRESNGITIGLEGSWGSGKSSVISMLKKKLSNIKGKRYSIFQFDTWAHEGDYLRKIFLTSFLKELMIELNKTKLDSKIEEDLEDCLDRISNHKIVKTITRKRTFTIQGIFFTFSALFVPFGAAFLSNINLESAALSGTFYPKLFIGLLTVFAPIICAFLNLICLTIRRLCLLSKNKDFKIFRTEHWSFLHDKDKEDETKEFSEENERTSIEFEEQFFNILSIIFDNNLLDKIILVIDNLDRVDDSYALKVWSTLQIFLQERNSASDKKQYFDRIWTLVPFDPDGLKSLWDANGDKDNSKSFFDKCFQLRIDVPKPIFSSWEKYLRNLMEMAIPNWKSEDKDTLVDTLRLTRKSTTDIPTPRELKNYINQTAYLASRWGSKMNISSIAYFIVWRELEHKSVSEIRERIKDSKLIEFVNGNKTVDYTEIHNKYLKSNHIADIAGLIFGVAREKGYELLLLPEIENALETNDADSLIKLKDSNNEGFWTLFNQFILSKAISNDKLLKYSIPILNTLSDDEVKLKNYIYRLKNIGNIKIYDYYENYGFEEYHSALMLLQEDERFLGKIYRHLKVSFTSSFSKLEKEAEKIKMWIINSYSIMNNLFDDVIPIFNKIAAYELPFDVLQYKNWIDEYSKSENIRISKKYHVKQELLDSLSAELPGLSIFEKLNFNMFKYILNNEVEHNWKSFHSNAYKLLTRQPSAKHNYLIDFILELILNDFYEEANRTAYRDTWPLYNAVHNLEDEELISSAILIGFLQGNKLDNPEPAINPQNNSAQGLDNIKKFWKTDNTDSANSIIDRLGNFDTEFIWKIANNSKFLLALRIIAISAEEGKLPALFKGDNKLGRLNDIIKFNYYKECRDIITVSFMKDGDNLKNELLNDVSITYPGSVYYYLKNSTSLDSQVKTFLINTLKEFDIERWKKELKEASYFLDIAIQLTELTQGKIHQSNTFRNALVDTSEDVFADGSSVDPWTLNHWDNLINILTKSSINTYQVAIKKMFQENFLNSSIEFMQINQDFLDFNSFLQDAEKTTTLFIEILKIKDKKKYLFLIEQINRLEIETCKNIADEQKNFVIEEIKKNESFFEDLTSEEINTFLKLFKIDFSFGFNKEEK